MFQNISKSQQPTVGEVHVDGILTNISVAYLQSLDNFVADKVFPLVPVQKQSDMYFTYPKQQWFRQHAEVRPPSTETVGSGYKQATESYMCEVYGFHKDIDDRIMANYDAPLEPMRDGTEFVSRALTMKKEYDFVTSYLTTGVWDTDINVGTNANYDEWDDYDESTPIEDITALKRSVLEATGFKPNRMVMGGKVWDAIQNHPSILDRIKYTREAIDINPALIARAFDLDQLVIAEGIYDQAHEGDTMDLTPFVDDIVFLYYAPSRPGLLQPSAGYIFTWNGYLQNPYGVALANFYMRHIKSTRVEGEMAYDMKVIGSELGVFMHNVIT